MSIQFNDTKQTERLEELHIKEEEQLAQMLSKKYGVGYVDLTRQGISPDALKLIPESDAREAELAAFKLVNKTVYIAARSPKRADTIEKINIVKSLGYSIKLYMVSLRSLEYAWGHYKDLSFATASDGGVINLSSETITSMQNDLKNIEDIKVHIGEALASTKAHRVSRILEVLLGGALALDASDVHIEPEDEYIHVRYRLDGVLTNVMDFDATIYKLLRSRIKLLSGMKINITNTAQDGRFSINVDGQEIEIRSSVIPGAYGESVVLRVLDPSALGLDIDAVGMDEHLKKTLLHEISKPNGMILNTGPTGSGKTTTLYAFLNTVNNPDIKIITLENPIEYHLQGIVQTQITKNYSFADGLRAILRQDPDVIMVGEIRDPEVASTAVNAALTGHLVFSTLHTNNAAGTFPRIIDLDVAPEIIGAALSVSMAQRLTRRLCTQCRVSKPMTKDEQTLVNKILKDIPRPDDLPNNRDTLWHPAESGCDACQGTGYKGRIAIMEAVLVDTAVEEAVRNNPSEADIWRVAKPQGIRRMAEDGIVKALEGITSLEELGRVVDLTEDLFRN
jgi:type II secretory ATPase GspE/PulE/Tfp pilus assembly ATPase PilB-like protein